MIDTIINARIVGLLDWCPGWVPAPLMSGISKWTLASALHKSIRRGRSNKAAQVAQELWSQEMHYFWRRMAITALEDVGHGDPVLVAAMFTIAKSPVLRINPELAWKSAWELASVPKDRSSGDLIVWASTESELALVREQVVARSKWSIHDLVQELKQGGDWGRLAILWMVLYGSSIDKKLAGSTTRSTMTADLAGELGASPIVREVMLRAHGWGCQGMEAVYGMTSLMATGGVPVTDSWVETQPDIMGLPAATFDQFCHLGKRAIRRWLDVNLGLKDWVFKVRGKADPVELITQLLFWAEGDALVHRMLFPGAMELRSWALHAWVHKLGALPEAAVMGEEMVRRYLSVLHNARVQVVC